MFRSTVYCIILLLLSIYYLQADEMFNINQEQKNTNVAVHDDMSEILNNNILVQKQVLKNGLTVLVCEDHTQPKVSIQMFYHVGSKDEALKEKGIAHLIEHMIFKGTEKLLSESDIDTTMRKISGTTNAFTTYDYTGYLFNVHSVYWKEIFPILADCMQFAEFDSQKLNSEMKAVIQELKMYRDSYFRALAEEMLSAMFLHHPYHYPIIGYKEDLWNVTGDDLKAFFKSHYFSNNATLVVVGDVNAQEVFKEAEKIFGHIKPNLEYKKIAHIQPEDIIAKSTTLYREVEQPILVCAFSVPGFTSKTDELSALTSWILAEKRNCRLYKKLVDELQIATSVSAPHWSLFDHTFFFIAITPTMEEKIPQIEQVIKEILLEIASVGISDDEIKRAVKNYKMGILETMEDFEERAFEIGSSFLGTKDPEYSLNALKNKTMQELKKEVELFISRYLRPSVMHIGKLLPIAESEKKFFHEFQHASDMIDTQILSARIRTTKVEEPRYANQIIPKMPSRFNFPKPHIFTLENGLKLLSYQREDLNKIAIILQFKAYESCYEPDDKPGLYTFLASMMEEGTKNYTAAQLAEFLESRAMTLSISAGKIAIECLSEDLNDALMILKELVSEVNFPQENIEKVRTQMLAAYKAFWDNPKSFSNQLFDEIIYKGHPWSKDPLGDEKSIREINKSDLVALYNKFISPDGARIVVVGSMPNDTVKELVTAHLNTWKKVSVDEIKYPLLETTKEQIVDYVIARDQVVLMLGNLSIDRFSKDYEYLLIFDQIFGGGVLGSMMSRLFALREATGLFYTIQSSLISGADYQPGTFIIKTIVSKDRMEEAINAIKKAVDSALVSLTDEEINEAKRAILYAQSDLCSTSASIAQTMISLDRLGLPLDYYDMRQERFSKINKSDIINIVKKYLKSDKLVVLRVGRV